MKITWDDLGCPDGPGIYAFKDGTINVRQQEISIWIDHPGARFTVRSFRPGLVSLSTRSAGANYRTKGGTLVDSQQVALTGSAPHGSRAGATERGSFSSILRRIGR